MKKLFFLLLAFVLVNVAFAQTAKKKATPASKPTVVELSTKEPSFAGFTSSFIKFGKMSGNGRPFTVSVEYKPWFFEIKGVANAGHNTEDLDMLLEDIVMVLAYYNAPGAAADGTNYQAGLFDFMIYLEDEPLGVSNLNFTLKGAAAQSSAIVEQAKTWNFEQGKVFKTQKYSSAILKAQAKALDKSDIAKEKAAEKKKIDDSIAAYEAEQARIRKAEAEAVRRKAEEEAAAKLAIKADKWWEKLKNTEKVKIYNKNKPDDDDDDYYEPPVKKTPAKKR